MDDYLFSMCQTPVPDIAKGLENKYNRPILKLYGVLHLEYWLYLQARES